MNYFKCDRCGKETKLSPKCEPVFEEKEVEKVVKIGKIVKKEEKIRKIEKVPVMVDMLRQNSATGEMQRYQVQKVKDLEPRAHIVRLTLGQESIQKDFCTECLDMCKSKLLEAWDFLMEIENQ